MKSILIFIFFCLVFYSSFSYKPTTDIKWMKCEDIKPTNSLQRSLHSSKTSLKQFKKYYLSHYANLNSSKFNPILFKSYEPLIDPYIPETELEWRKVQETIQNAECSLTKLPFLWDKKNDDSEKRTINYFVKRFKAKKQPAIGQVWFLQGGPGADGSVFYGFAQLIKEKLDENYDVYVPDHRGTGRSSFLKCNKGSLLSVFSEDIKGCVSELTEKYGKNNDFYGWSTRQAAEDTVYIANVSKPLNKPDQKIIIYGVSYGTYLLNKILYLFPNDVDGAIADSVVKIGIDFSKRDLDFLETGNYLFDTCQNSTFCSNKFQKAFKKDPSKVIEEVYKNQDINKKNEKGCLKSIYPADDLRIFFASIIADTDLRRFVLPMLYRLNRCNGNDKTFLSNIGYIFSAYVFILKEGNKVRTKTNLNYKIDGFKLKFNKMVLNLLLKALGSDVDLNQLFNDDGLRGINNDDDKKKDEKIPPMSMELMMMIVMGELIDSPMRTIEQYDKLYNNNYPPYFRFPMGILFNSMKIIKKTYQTQYPLKLASNYKNPLMILQGSLDPQTPKSYAYSWYDTFTPMDKKYFYWFKNSVHGQAFRTLMKKNKKQACGRNILYDFIKKVGKNEPNPKPNIDCLLKDEYIDSPNFDFENFQVPSQLGSIQSYLLLILKSLMFGHKDLWEGSSWISVNVIMYFMILLIGVMIIGLFCCCSICIHCCICVPLIAVIATIILLIVKKRSKKDKEMKDDINEPYSNITNEDL